VTQNDRAATATVTAAPERQLFGTDGIRGVANEHPMTPELALKLGRAVTFVAGRGKTHVPRILIGKDTRISGYMLETALVSGICSMGGEVLLCGPIPTPGVAHLTSSMRVDAGIVISASHNPYPDNGIKIFGSDGFKLPDEAEAEIEGLMADESQLGPRHTGQAIGRAEKLEDARGRYVAFVKNTFPRDLSLDGMKVVVDAGHGAAYRVAPLVFDELGAHVTALGVDPDGLNINEGAGALHPAQAQAEVLRRGAAIGIALDGDADRVIVIDEKGNVVDGDAVMALCALRMLRDGQLRNNTVVATVMSNLGLERSLEAHGGRLLRTPVGDRYVVEAMRQGGHNLGGEQSGHLIFLDHCSTGDGVVAGLQVLAMMLRAGRPLSELAATSMERVPQILENVSLSQRRPLEEMAELAKASDAVRNALGRDGRLLVRWSGTEAKLRIMLEGPDEGRLRGWSKELAAAAVRDAGARS
jgi:phosphoglucosamine mutase